MQCAARLAQAALLVAIERGKQRRQILDDVGDAQLDAMHAVATAETEPLKRVPIRLAARTLDDEATEPGIGRCGECRTCGGNIKTSPSRTGTS